MSEILTPDICVIGAGSGGLTVAAAAAQFGVSVVLIEKAKMGGDCLNTGCVPSKAMIAAGKQAHVHHTSAAFGVHYSAPDIDFAAVHDHVQSVIAAIEPHDSVERFTGLGVHVIQDHGQFEDAQTVRAGDHLIRARRFVIATGSSPAAPPIPGLDSIDYITNETIFDRTDRPEHLIVIGGGPIGMELAQAHGRLGAKVTVLEAFTALGKDDPQMTKIVLEQVRSEGVDIREGIKITGMSGKPGDYEITLEEDDAETTLTGSHVLVAAGRRPNVNGLGLDAAGIAHERSGITVDAGLRTSNRKVYAIGDVAGGLQFTHWAGYHAGLVIRSALFRLPAKENRDLAAWATYTDPEMAHAGLTEDQARDRHGAIKVLSWPFDDNDRARAERQGKGFIKVITNKKGRVLGTDIVGAHASELIAPWALAISSKLKIGAMTGAVLPYPTLSEAGKRAAIGYYASGLTNPWVRRIIKFLRMFG